MKSIEIRDFSGGLTDFAYNSDPRFCKEADNFLLEKDKTLYTRNGIGFFDLNNPIIPQGSERISRLDTLKDQVVAFAGLWVDIFSDTGIQTVPTPNGNLLLSNANFATIHDSAKWQDQLFIVDDSFSQPVKVFIDGTGTPRGVQAGLPSMVSNPLLTPSVAETSSYIYAFNYKYTYTVGSETLISYGPVTYTQITNGPDFSIGETVTISSIPVLSSGLSSVYDDTNIVKQIHRTEDGGLTYYLVAEIPNATTSYVDSTTNLELVNNQIIYNQATNAVYSSPMPSKYIEIINNIGWYGNCYDGESFPNRVYQSIPAIPDAVPRDNYIEFDEEVTGIGSYDIYPIIFTKTKVYRLEGFIDSFGSGVIIKKVISDVIGGVSNNSIVKTSSGLYWAGNDGFYRTDAFRASKISGQIEYRYKEIVSNDTKKKRIYGAYDTLNKRIYWACQRGQVDNDFMFVFDESFECFTAISAKETTLPSSLIYRSEEMIIGDARGVLFSLSEGQKKDLVYDNLTSPSEWKTTPIIYNFLHIDYDFGTFDINKWVTRISVFGKQITPVDFIISAFNNGSNNESFTYPVKYTQGMNWNDTGYPWGDEGLIWGGQAGFMYVSRRFRCGRLRLRHKSFRVQNAKAILRCSTDNSLTELVIDPILKTATSQDVGILSFSGDEDGYFLEILGVLYLIDRASNSTLQLIDTDNTLTSGNFQFKIVGIPKSQTLHIDGVVYSLTDQDNDISWYQGGEKE